MPDRDRYGLLDLGDCDVCDEPLTGGSHYHCGRCRDPKPTSQYGHYTRFVGGDYGFSCDPANLGRALSVNNKLTVTEDMVRPAHSQDRST